MNPTPKDKALPLATGTGHACHARRTTHRTRRPRYHNVEMEFENSLYKVFTKGYLTAPLVMPEMIFRWATAKTAIRGRLIRMM